MPRATARRQEASVPAMKTARLETLADGVIAIAATLLVLNVDTQVGDSTTDLRDTLLRIWPSYVAYVVSFVTIGIIWVNHHTVMSLLARVDRTFLFLSIGFLMCVAFIPFPTRLVAEHLLDEGAQSATIAYGLTLTATAIFFSGLWFYASGDRRLLRQDADERVVRGISRSYRPGAFVYLGATLVGLVSPIASAGCFAAIAAFYVVDSGFFGRDARSERSAGGDAGSDAAGRDEEADGRGDEGERDAGLPAAADRA